MSLYTKYRPKDWDSVIGQDRIRTILRNSLTHDTVGHAYLFHGSRGTGKTTSARILAKGVNCLDLKDGNPCHACANCVAFDEGTMLDVIEIDAASNTGVDNIRDLIERARFEPNQGKYKVYIIDEVHMLSTGAFNALLKTLEEPPSHVKFILATTEIDKVPETIRSRALRFDFRKITEVDIIKRLNYVIAEEGIRAEDAALQIIAKYARGGLRDALTLLEQNTIDGELSLEHVRMTLSLLDEHMIDGIIESLKAGDTGGIFDTLAYLRDMHVNARAFFEQLMYRLRDLMIEHIDDDSYIEYLAIYEIIEGSYTRVRLIPDGMLLIEVTLLKIARKGKKDGGVSSTKHQPQGETAGKSEKKVGKIDNNSQLGTRRKDTVGTNMIEVSNPEEGEEEGTGRLSETHGVREVQEKDDGSLHSQEGQKKEISSIPHPDPYTKNQEPSTKNRAPRTEHQEPSTNIPFSYVTLLEEIKKTKPSLVTDLKTARFERDGTKLILIFSKNWNYDRVNTGEIKNILTEILSATFGGEWIVECQLGGALPQTNIVDGVFA